MRARLNAETWGNRENPVIVMLHGFMGRASSFSEMAEALAGKFFVAAFDLPGHGLSRFSGWAPDSRPESFSGAADMVLDGLDRLGIRRFFLYGYSMGGRLAQAVCLGAPERVEALILESASFGIPDAAEREKRYAADLALLSGVSTKEKFSAFLARWHQAPLFSSLRGTALLDSLIAEKLENDPDELKAALAVLSVGNHPHFLPSLAELTVPVDFLYGEGDEKYAACALSAKKAMDRMTLHSFAGASHDVHSQFPVLTAKTIIDIVSSLNRP